MTKRIRKLLVGLMILVSLHFGLERLVRWRVSCGETCAGLGADCEPLKAALEARVGQAKAGEPALLWYRATLKNTSCETLSAGIGDFFSAGKGLLSFQPAREISYFRFTDAAGSEIVPASADMTGGVIRMENSSSAPVVFLTKSGTQRLPWQDALKDVHDVEPYIADLPAVTPDSEADQIPRLAPGQSITTRPTKYWPHRREYRSMGDGARALTVGVTVPVPDGGRPIAPRPPEGFRIMDFFMFTRPGTYRMQLVFATTVYADAHYVIDSLPAPIGASIHALSFVLLAWGTPATYARKVEVRSNWVEIEVAR